MGRAQAAWPQLCHFLWARLISAWTSVTHWPPAGCWDLPAPPPLCYRELPAQLQGPWLRRRTAPSGAGCPLGPLRVSREQVTRSQGHLSPDTQTYTRCKSTGLQAAEREVVTEGSLWLRGWGTRDLAPPSISLSAILHEPHGGSPVHLLHRPGLAERGPLPDAQRGPGARTLSRGRQPLSTGFGNAARL